MITSNLFSIWKSREAELDHKLTYAQVSKATGITPATLSRWMNGQSTRFGSRTIKRLCAYFDCTIDELLVDKEA